MNVFRFTKRPYGSSSFKINMRCPVCGSHHSKRLLKRRIRKHQEVHKGAVSVTVVAYCQVCGVRGHHRISIDGDTLGTPTLKGVS